jgi:SOS-response transcriptional repressor LexA
MVQIYRNGLAAAMKRLGIGPTALAAEVGTTKQNIDRWARGERKLTVPWAEKIAPVLQTTAGELLLSDGGGIQRIPLLDWIQAGRLTNTRSQLPMEDVPLLAFADLGRGEFFALRVHGASMDRVSPDGSVIVVDKSDKTLLAGRFYVFAVRGATTYKRWQAGKPSYLAAFSTDPAEGPIFIEKRKDFEVVGRVRRTMLDL